MIDKVFKMPNWCMEAYHQQAEVKKGMRVIPLRSRSRGLTLIQGFYNAKEVK